LLQDQMWKKEEEGDTAHPQWHNFLPLGSTSKRFTTSQQCQAGHQAFNTYFQIQTIAGTYNLTTSDATVHTVMSFCLLVSFLSTFEIFWCLPL
jgi:hypothetical protein